MNEHHLENLEFFGKSAAVVFTGILGTGTIFGLKHQLVRDGFTAAMFWACVVGFAVAAISGAAMTLHRRAGFTRCRRLLAILMLVGFIVGIVSCGVLTTLRDWRWF
ncbi:MAG TPA: hypothetical protein PKY77_26225 [Phycisphaerae bacterium]|nr:hypothetical protein [Phycisphaerae bacterium]HRY70870.1 hypothetical protein [Phycisphaerae bacterium]HSA29130.1 hypothetical protein [Phycisphaerae bacterium]